MPATTTMNKFGRVFTRAFHPTPTDLAKHSKKRLECMLQDVPPYPQPIQHHFKQSWFGLYGESTIQFGNNVPESKHKTRRFWLPNVRSKKLYSRALNQFISLDVTANVLRTIDKLGGLDNYVLGIKSARVKELGPMGWKLRWRIINTPSIRARFAAEREALGLPPLEIEQPKAASTGKKNVSVNEEAMDTMGTLESVETMETVKEAVEAPQVTKDEVGNFKI